MEGEMNSAGGITISTLLRDVDFSKLFTSVFIGVEVNIEKFCLVEVKIITLRFPIVSLYA